VSSPDVDGAEDLARRGRFWIPRGKNFGDDAWFVERPPVEGLVDQIGRGILKSSGIFSTYLSLSTSRSLSNDVEVWNFFQRNAVGSKSL
jgi:hypothetical protein